MQTATHHSAAALAMCPMHAAVKQPPRPEQLVAADELVLPLQRRVVTQFATNEAGKAELRLYCDDKEISFDEPEFFAFGQTLAQQSQFAAGAATRWGQGYEWAQVLPLLEELLQAGVLQRAQTGETTARRHGETGARPAPLPPGPCEQPRLWNDAKGCEQLMQQITGRPLELGWLEMVLPIFRVAHLALDADGRQVGEANVFPKAMRLDVATNWRACIYAGTRYQTGRPMNVSALKAMRQHWGAMMFVLNRVRAAYLQRFELDGQQWTVAQLERLATSVLALPTYQLMREAKPVANGELHPALSCLFRVTDGLRMTMHQMLFVPIAEPTLKPDAPMSSAEILAYAERNYSFHSEHGVCAGPQAMIEEFLAVLVDGAPVVEPADWPADLALALAEIEPAIDYALHGLRVHAAVFSLWPAMARSYEQLARLTQDWAVRGSVAVQRLSLQFEQRVAGMQRGTYVAQEAWRADREAVYADMYAQCGLGLAARGVSVEAESLPLQLQPLFSCGHARVDAQIEAHLQRLLGRADGSDRAAVQGLRKGLMDFLLRVQTTLRVAGESQSQLNALLGREQPQRTFDSADLDITQLLQGTAERRLPYLVDELQAMLGLRVHVSADAIQLVATPFDAQPAARQPNSTGMVPEEKHASRMHLE